MDRYADIIPDFESFKACLLTPQPHYIRVNTLKVTEQEVISKLEKLGFILQKVSFAKWFYEVIDTPGYSITHTLYHWLGWFYVQDIAPGLVSPILDPQEDELILDLAAAPGGKTTHIAQIMKNTGTIIANEPVTGRLRSLQANTHRMGVLNTIITQHNGIMFPDSGPFDRVLVDVPCSGEGRARETKSRRKGAEEGFIESISGTQKGLLRRAIQLTKPGGIIVYSTCTFAPEENEAVVNYALQNEPCEIVPIEMAENIPHSKGLIKWQGMEFDESLRYTIRIYPHQLDSGGMYIAKLRRL